MNERCTFPALTNMTHNYAKQDVVYPCVSYATPIKLHDHCNTFQTRVLAQTVVRLDRLTNAAQLLL